MQPNHEASSNHQAETAPWQQPAPNQPAYAPAPRPAVVRSARPWLVACTALVTLLVLIAAIGNQGVVDAVNRHVSGTSFWDNTARAATWFRWRFSPIGDHDFAHLWLAGLVAIGVALVLTLLLVAVVARGRGGFGQVFVAVWLAVIGATLLAGYASAAVVDERRMGVARDAGKANLIFYSPSSPGPYTVAAGIGYGLVVALVAALVAVLSRRSETLQAALTGAPPPPEDALRSQPRSWAAPPVSDPSPWPGAAGAAGAAGAEPQQHTAVLPNVDPGADRPGSDRPRHDEQHTTQLPRMEHPDPPADQRPDAPHTTQLPRVEGEDDPYRRP